MLENIPGKKIFIDQLEEMFENIASGPGWDMGEPMLWGHFFTHHEPSLLESAVEKLEGMGLGYVDIFLSEKESDDEPDLFWLHMEEIRAHSPQSLDKRNDEFYLFADREGIGSYDGMDVGPVQ